MSDYLKTFTAKQKANLAKLATYLEGLPEDYGHFNMGTFFEGSECYSDRDLDEAAAVNRDPTFECGSCACAIGHGPIAGIRVYMDASWDAYAERVFGVSHSDDCFGGPGIGAYMFGVSNPNDHLAAARRIRRVLAGDWAGERRDERAYA